MPRSLCSIAWVIVLIIGIQVGEASNASWPQWRGPGFQGSTGQGSYPESWAGEDGLAWKFELPGRGFSTPVVWNEHIIVTAPIDGKDGVLNLDFSGKPRWQTALTPEKSGKHRNASGCNPSPITDGETVFAYFKSGTLAALDFGGKVIWQTNLQQIFGEDKLWWDVGTSPVLTRDYVVAMVLHGGDSGLVAFHKKSGEIAWQLERSFEVPNENWDSYTTPIVIEHAGQEIILVWGADHVTAHRVSDGGFLWSSGGFNPNSKPNWPSVASPVVAGDVLVVTYGRGQYTAGIRLGGEGDVTEANRIWTREGVGAFVPTPAVHNGKVYLLGDRGEITCIDPESGETIWEDALPKHRGKYYASPTIAGGSLYAAREDGVVFVARIEGAFEVLSENPMGEKMIASPVPVADQLLLRGEQSLFLVGSN